MDTRTSRFSVRQRLVLGLVAALLLGLGGLGSLTADAAGPIGQARVTVRESDHDVNTGLRIKRGQRVVVNCTGQIWAGVILTGNNGPEGWTSHTAGAAFPLPGVAPFSVLGKLDSGYFYIGEGIRLKHQGGASTLVLRINDDVPGNGNGAFTCDVKVYAARPR